MSILTEPEFKLYQSYLREYFHGSKQTSNLEILVEKVKKAFGSDDKLYVLKVPTSFPFLHRSIADNQQRDSSDSFPLQSKYKPAGTSWRKFGNEKMLS